jgi:hypothetical protein
MEKEFTLGLTEKSMMAITLKTKKKDKDNLIGLMEIIIMDSGRMASSMVKEH